MGIENGFKKQKHFLVRITSTERDYRFFNVAFTCVLYNIWRCVDLLVKIAIDGEETNYLLRVLGENVHPKRLQQFDDMIELDLKRAASEYGEPDST